MKLRGQIKRFPVGFVLAAVTLSAILPASAQVPPPNRERSRDRPNYVDSADYDRTPMYVEGVEYKPYVPERKPVAKPATEAVRTPAPPASPSPAPAQPQPQPQAQAGELRPFVPPAVSSAAPRQQQAQASSSAQASATTYARKKRPRYGVAIIEALDKISSESVRFEAPIGQPVRYKGLIYTVKACETAADDEPMADVVAYMQVRTNPVVGPNNQVTVKSKEIFRGWSYASTPSLNPIQHPIYDAWVIGCRKPLNAPAATPASTPAKAPAAPATS